MGGRTFWMASIYTAVIPLMHPGFWGSFERSPSVVGSSPAGGRYLNFQYFFKNQGRGVSVNQYTNIVNQFTKDNFSCKSIISPYHTFKSPEEIIQYGFSLTKQGSNY